MKKRHFTEAQVGFGVREAESGTCVAKACRTTGISEQTSPPYNSRVTKNAKTRLNLTNGA
jgi:hypothetical protein